MSIGLTVFSGTQLYFGVNYERIYTKKRKKYCKFFVKVI